MLLGFTEVSNRIYYGYITENILGVDSECLVMCFIPNEGFGEHNPRYFFRCVEVFVGGFKKVNGVKLRTQVRHYEFYGTGLDTTTKEFWEITNDIKLNLRGYDVNCPKQWAYKLKGDLQESDFRGLLTALAD